MKERARAFSLVSGSLRYALTPGEIIIGRSPDAAISLADKAASREHALLRVSVGSVEVVDLGSSNGTFVNQRRVRHPTPLEPGDALVVGDTELMLAVDDVDGEDIWARKTAVPREADSQVSRSGNLEQGATPVPSAGSALPDPFPEETTQVRSRHVLLLLDDRRWAKEIRRAAALHPNLEVAIDQPANARAAIGPVAQGLLLLDVGALQRKQMDELLRIWRTPHSRGPVLIASGIEEHEGVVLARSLSVDGFVRTGKPAILVMGIFNYHLRRASQSAGA